MLEIDTLLSDRRCDWLFFHIDLWWNMAAAAKGSAHVCANRELLYAIAGGSSPSKNVFLEIGTLLSDRRCVWFNFRIDL